MIARQCLYCILDMLLCFLFNPTKLQLKKIIQDTLTLCIYYTKEPLKNLFKTLGIINYQNLERQIVELGEVNNIDQEYFQKKW